MSIDWANIQATETEDPYPCDDCRVEVPLGDLVFCACRGMICQTCKDGEDHKCHETMDEEFDKVRREFLLGSGTIDHFFGINLTITNGD